MNRKSAVALIAIFSTLASSHAFAEGPLPEPVQFVSTKSRAQVQAELAAYQREGVNPWSIAYNPLKTFVSTQTREQATAEYLANREQVAAMTSEAGDFVGLKKPASPGNVHGVVAAAQ
ncbi:MAG TPA: DUF4148 domain-containing protein [Ramlibacter sp.]|nr:DUF4148 domain-containing protein [Ramlibacter sp.]